MSDVAAVLNRAADLLEQDGWTQGMSFNRATGCRCAMGAINEVFDRMFVGPAAKGSLAVWRDAVWAVRSKIEYSSIPAWNDTEGRTATEVIAALRNAAKDTA